MIRLQTHRASVQVMLLSVIIGLNAVSAFAQATEDTTA